MVLAAEKEILPAQTTILAAEQSFTGENFYRGAKSLEGIAPEK
ncbi:hypothetical protein [Lysinibacillus xylanilyticus]|uniref:Uncharacterized protein n=1 Tax=Lysinibacillus xylanilyticus TaxID=582475 RepID=A0ABV3W1C0_9BACI